MAITKTKPLIRIRLDTDSNNKKTIKKENDRKLFRVLLILFIGSLSGICKKSNLGNIIVECKKKKKNF